MLCCNHQIKCCSSKPGGNAAGQTAWQPAQMPRGRLLGTKWHLCSASKCCKKSWFAVPALEEVLFGLRRGCRSSSHAACSCCLPAFSPKRPGQVEVSFDQEETLQKALMSCLAQGGKAWFLDFSSCLQILRARDRLVNGCHAEGKSNFHPQVSRYMGPAGSPPLDTAPCCD